MSTVQDTLQDGKELSHIDKLSKVIGAVQEAFNDGIDPKRIHKVIQMFLSQKKPLSTSETQGLDIQQHSQDLINVAAASATTGCPNASSLMRGLPYHHSAQDLTNEFLAAAGQNKVKCHDEHKQQASPMGKDETFVALSGDFDQAPCGQKQPENAFIFNNFLRPRSMSGGEDEWVTLNDEPILCAPKEDEQKLKKEEKEGNLDRIVVVPQLTHIKDFAYKDDVAGQKDLVQEVVSKPSRNKTVTGTKKATAVDKKSDKKATNKKAIPNTKKTAAAVKSPAASDTTTAASYNAQAPPVKRRGGRPVGYRKQANGKFGFPEGSAPKGKDQSSSEGGDKKRKASADDVAISSSNNKRQRKGKAKSSKAAVTQDTVVDKKKKGSKVEKGKA